MMAGRLMAHRDTTCPVCGKDFDCESDCTEPARLKEIEDRGAEILNNTKDIEVLMNVMDRHTGNTINGDVWRLALEVKGKLDFVCCELRSLETYRDTLAACIELIEKRWSGDTK